mmetsp:Transcript_32661/g.66630  ORF Transcript_32661/g.66630 Transcript_32661/m.66630 type:complete len:113 (-) Transcript_32661:410-748(-)
MVLIEKAIMAPAKDPNDAMKNDPNKLPHCLSAFPLKLVPRRSSGVAKVSDIFCKNEDDGLPPGARSVIHPVVVAEVDNNDGINPTLDNTKATAIAVTGAPRSLPTKVFFPSS